MCFRLSCARKNRPLNLGNGIFYCPQQSAKTEIAVKKPCYQDLLTAVWAKKSTQPLYQRLGASMVEMMGLEPMESPPHLWEIEHDATPQQGS